MLLVPFVSLAPILFFPGLSMLLVFIFHFPFQDVLFGLANSEGPASSESFITLFVFASLLPISSSFRPLLLLLPKPLQVQLLFLRLQSAFVSLPLFSPSFRTLLASFSFLFLDDLFLPIQPFFLPPLLQP
jgi:hypothetical protein